MWSWRRPWRDSTRMHEVIEEAGGCRGTPQAPDRRGAQNRSPAPKSESTSPASRVRQDGSSRESLPRPCRGLPNRLRSRGRPKSGRGTSHRSPKRHLPVMSGRKPPATASGSQPQRSGYGCTVTPRPPASTARGSRRTTSASLALHICSRTAPTCCVQELPGHENTETTVGQTRGVAGGLKRLHRMYHPRKNELNPEGCWKDEGQLGIVRGGGDG